MMGEKSDVWIRKSGATTRARQLRKSETEAEYRLCSDLRNRLLNGHKFSRQIPLGPYIADFVCRDKNLIVELDRSQHSESQHDWIRTQWLNKHGYSVLRFWNEDVLRERRAVLDTMLAVLSGRITSSEGAIRFSPASHATNLKNEGTLS